MVGVEETAAGRCRLMRACQEAPSKEGPELAMDRQRMSLLSAQAQYNAQQGTCIEVGQRVSLVASVQVGAQLLQGAVAKKDGRVLCRQGWLLFQVDQELLGLLQARRED